VGGRCLATSCRYRKSFLGGVTVKKEKLVCPKCGYEQEPPFWAFCPLCGFTFPACWAGISRILQKRKISNVKKEGGK